MCLSKFLISCSINSFLLLSYEDLSSEHVFLISLANVSFSSFISSVIFVCLFFSLLLFKSFCTLDCWVTISLLKFSRLGETFFTLVGILGNPSFELLCLSKIADSLLVVHYDCCCLNFLFKGIILLVIPILSILPISNVVLLIVVWVFSFAFDVAWINYVAPLISKIMS